MKSKSNFGKKIVMGAALLIMAGWLSVATAPADQPLSKDDITLLLLASSPTSKMIQMVEQQGVDFQMNPDLAKKFHDQGASNELIDALQKAGNKAAAAKVSAPAPAAPSAPAPAPPAAAQPSSPAAPEPPAAERPTLAPTTPAAPSSSEPVLHTRQSTASAPEPSPEGKPNAPDAPEPWAAEAPPAAPTTPVAPSSSEPTLHTRTSEAAPVASAPSPAPASPSSSEPTLHQPAKQEAPKETPVIATTPALKDPDAPGIQHIIQEFAAKEKIFRAARNNYVYHQINKVQEFGGENEIVGTYEQEWDILYDDSGKRIEKVTYAPLNTLKGLIITKEDIEGFRNITPFVLTTDELPDYEITYLGHVKVDEITAYVFRIRPKAFEKGRQYFQGVVYVDDRDLQIVKSEGKQVPQAKSSHGQENLFPRFTTWREQVDGKFWFPTYTMADDTLYFSQGPPIHMKEIVRYTDYKQFKSSGRILTVESVDKPKDQSAPAATPPKK